MSNYKFQTMDSIYEYIKIKKFFYPGWWRYCAIGAMFIALLIFAIIYGGIYLYTGRVFNLIDYSDDIEIFYCILAFWMTLGGISGVLWHRAYVNFMAGFRKEYPKMAKKDLLKYGWRRFRITIIKDLMTTAMWIPLVRFTFSFRLPSSPRDFVMIAFYWFIAAGLYILKRHYELVAKVIPTTKSEIK